MGDRLCGKAATLIWSDYMLHRKYPMERRILFIEDNNLHREATRKILQFHGYNLLCLPDGEKFWEAIASFRPNLLLLDLKLPGVDGLTLLKQLRQSYWCDLPVVVLSADVMESSRQQAYSLGVSSYLIKPVSLKQVAATLDTELAQRLELTPA